MRNAGVDHKVEDQYTIDRLPLMEGNIPRYRIKNKVDGHERMVFETEIGSR